MDDLHGVGRLADRTRAFRRLGDLATINIDLDGMITDLTSEEGIFHIWNNGGGANNEALDRNNFVDI